MSDFGAGATLAVRRLATPRAAFVALCATLLVALDARLELAAEGAAAADHVLGGAAFGAALPVVAYLVLDQVTGRARLSDALTALARHGANRRSAALGVLCVCALLLAVSGLLLGVLGAALSRPHADPRWPSDVLAAARIGAIAGLAYAALFGAGSMIGKLGGGRAIALALDWALGPTAWFVAVPWPRAHLRNLLGFEPVLGWPQWTATPCLLGLAVVCVSWTMLRTDA